MAQISTRESHSQLQPAKDVPRSLFERSYSFPVRPIDPLFVYLDGYATSANSCGRCDTAAKCPSDLGRRSQPENLGQVLENGFFANWESPEKPYSDNGIYLLTLSFLRVGNYLMHFHREKLDIRKAVPAVKTMPQEIHIQFGAGG